MKGDTLFMVIFGFGLIAYIYFYINGRQYLREYFQGAPDSTFDPRTQLAGSNSPMIAEVAPEPPPAPPRQPGVLMEYPNRPYETEAIQSLDTYEYNLVYENESDRGLSKTLRDKLMAQRPMDWSNLPPSSAQFQAGMREAFEDAPASEVPEDAKPYQALGAPKIPDTLEIEEKEREILQTYQPHNPGSMTTYDVDDAMKLIDKIYSAKGEVATVYHNKDTNVYEIVGVRKKDEKIMYEDEEAPASSDPQRAAGEATIEAPQTATDVAAARDPFYDPTMKSRIGKWDYTGWTPGLERMFSPTDPKQNWY